MTVHPTGKDGETRAHPDVRSVLSETCLWSVFQRQVACFSQEQVYILDKAQGTICASFAPSLEGGERVHRLVFSGSHVFMATQQRIIVKPLQEAPSDLIPEGISLKEVDHFFFTEDYLVIGASTQLVLWKLGSDEFWQEEAYPCQVEKAFIFNGDLYVSCINSAVYCDHLEQGRNRELMSEASIGLTLFGNSKFFALSGDNGSTALFCRSGSGEVTEHLISFGQRPVGIDMYKNGVIAVSECRTMCYNLASENLENYDGEKGICGLYASDNGIYFFYAESVNLMSNWDMEEELLFRRKKCGELRRICQVEESYLLDIGGKTFIWPEEKKGCCAMM